MLVRMVSMRLPESETTKLRVVVPVRVAPVLSKTAPLQLPPAYLLKLSVPDPVVGSKVVVPTWVVVPTPAGSFVPKTGAVVIVMTPQKFPAASPVC